MNNMVIEVSLTLFWLAYLGLHVWLVRADPVEEIQMIHQAKG